MEFCPQDPALEVPDLPVLGEEYSTPEIPTSEAPVISLDMNSNYSVVNNGCIIEERSGQEPQVANFPSSSSFAGAVFNITNCTVNFNQSS